MLNAKKADDIFGVIQDRRGGSTNVHQLPIFFLVNHFPFYFLSAQQGIPKLDINLRVQQAALENTRSHLANHLLGAVTIENRKTRIDIGKDAPQVGEKDRFCGCVNGFL